MHSYLWDCHFQRESGMIPPDALWLGCLLVSEQLNDSVYTYDSWAVSLKHTGIVHKERHLSMVISRQMYTWPDK